MSKIVDDILKYKLLLETAGESVEEEETVEEETVEEDAMPLAETQQVSIIGYDSGTGPSLDQAAKDPKHHRKVNVVGMEFGHNGQPVLKFNELDGSGPFRAEWDSRYGWHADFS